MSHFKFHPSQKNSLIWPCLLFVFLGCGQQDKSGPGSRDAVKKKADTLASSPLARPITTDTITQTDCPRGAAEPLVKKNTFKDAHFALQPDGITGIETFSLPEGDKVKIKNFGCEYYILSFELTTSRFAADTTDLQYWANAVLGQCSIVTDARSK